MRRKAFLQAPFLIILAFVAVLLPIASILVDNKQEAMILGVHTGSIPTVRPTAAPAAGTSNSCVSEGGMVANGTAGCCSGLTKQNCSGSGSFVYCYCKKPVTNPIATPVNKTCTTRTWVGNVCQTRNYQRASNLACDVSNCSLNDPTPKSSPCIGEGGTVASGLHCCSGLTQRNCSGSGSFVTCKCEKPVTNPTATPVNKTCTTRTWVGNVCQTRNYQRASNLACDVSNCAINDPTPGLISPTKGPEDNLGRTIEPTEILSPTPTTYQMPIPTPTNIPVRLAGAAMGAVKTWLDASIFKCWQSSGKPEGCTCSNNLNCASQNCDAGKCQTALVNPINEVPREVIAKPTRAPIWFNVPWFKCWPASGRPDNCSCEKDSRCASQNCDAGKCQPIPEIEVTPQPTTDCVYGVDYNGDGIVNSIDMMKCLQDK